MRSRVESKVEIQVHSLSGVLCTVEAERDWDVHRIMRAIEKISNIPAREQFLYAGTDYCTSELLHKKLRDAKLVDLTLVRREFKEKTSAPPDYNSSHAAIARCMYRPASWIQCPVASQANR